MKSGLLAAGAMMAMQMAAMKPDERAFYFDEKQPDAPQAKPEPESIWEGERNKTRLSQYAAKDVKSDAVEAADKAWAAGGSPRAQIDAAREVNGRRLGYTAHQSDRERARTLAKLAKKQTKPPVVIDSESSELLGEECSVCLWCGANGCGERKLVHYKTCKSPREEN